jgi:2'-5' RNA ligase
MIFSGWIDDCIYIQLIDPMQASGKFPAFLAGGSALQLAPYSTARTMPTVLPATQEMTLASVQRDFVEWRKGRSHYAVWAIDVDTPALRSAIAAMRAHLVDYLLPDYRRQAHVTLHLCGFPAAVPNLDDDYPVATLQAQIAALQASAPPPFEVEIGNPDSFTSAAYFSVDDCVRGILATRRALAGGRHLDETFPYMPHVTCGLYRLEFPLAKLIQLMAACDTGLPARLQIDRLTLMAYEAANIGGPLTNLCEFDLATRQIRVLDQPLMAMLFGQHQAHESACTPADRSFKTTT